MNKIKLFFFATVRDRVGAKSIEMEIPLDMTIQGLKDKLVSAYPDLAVSMPSILFSINREYAFDDALVPPNAEIALFPPVSGG
jgi:molybdopterin converting factor small subunit